MCLGYLPPSILGPPPWDSPKGGRRPQAAAASGELLRAKEHLGRKGTSEEFFSFAENVINAHLKTFHVGTSLGVHWLRLHLPMQRVWVPSLVWELRSHMLCSKKNKTENRSNIVTNSIKTLKMIHIFKKILKEKKSICYVSICMENSMDRGAQQATVLGIAESDTTW